MKTVPLFSHIIEEVASFADAESALHDLSFFKTRKGEYGEGDLFYGVRTPILRTIAKKYQREISLHDLHELLTHPYHEIRLCALLIMTYIFPRSHLAKKKELVDFYLSHTSYINNWDLVDVSTHKIIGAYCSEIHNFDILYTLAKSHFLWEERIAIVANWTIIKTGNTKVILDLSPQFMYHTHDLIHKAVGWMLREMGKSGAKGYQELVSFLDSYAHEMPRTMLRYAIEKLPRELKQEYMKK